MFAHMIAYCERNGTSTNGSKFTTTGSQHLNLEISKDHIIVLEHTNRLFAGDNIDSKGLIYKDASGYGASKKLIARKLDQLGDIKSYSRIANSKERLV